MNLIKLFKTFLIDQFVFKLGGDSGGGQPTQSTSYNTNLPEYAKPYVTNMLESTQRQLFNVDDGGGITGFKPYKPYSSDVNNYTAGFSPMQQQAQRGTANLQVPGQYQAATNLTNQAAAGSLAASNQASGLQNQALGYGQAGAAYGGAGAQYGGAGAEQAQQAAALTGAQAGMYGGLGSQAGQRAADLSNLYGGLGAQSGQTAAGQSALYGGLGAQSGERYAGQSLGYGGMGAGLGLQAAGVGNQYAQQATSPAAMQAYMNPYVQSSLAPQLAEIQRQADITGTQQRSGAAKSGAFGGSREALMSAENQRAAQMAKQQAIGQGYDKAFQQAQQAQQYGANLGLQGLQAGMQGTAQGMQGVGQAGSQALAGYGMGLQGANQAGNQAMQGYGMGLQGAGQAGTQAMQGYGMGLQGVGAQQAAANLALQGTAQGMQGAGLGMQGAQAGQQGVQGAIGAGQYGLQGLGQAGQMANQLAGIGGQQLAAQQGIYSAQNAMGAQQQALEQQKINQAIQDYATQQQYPLMQLGFMSNMLRGLPMQATTTQAYQAQPSALNQGLGVLAGAAGAKQAGLFREGGTIKGLAQGGVTGYANTGMVQGNPASEVVSGVQAKLQMMSPEQLQQVAKTSPSEKIRAMALEMLQEYKIREQAEQQAKNSIMQDQKAMPTPVSQGVGLPAAPAPSLDGMASGGIIAFADEGQVSLNPDDEALLRQKYITAAQKQREALGLDASQAPRKEYYAKEAEDIARTKEENKGKYLMDLGLGLAGSTGNFIPSVARAASVAGVAAESRKESARSREGQLAKGLADVAEGERLIKLGDVTAGNAMYEKGAERINKVQVAGIKPKDTNQKDYANAYVAAAKAKGDKREEAIIYAEGTDKYVNAVQASRFAQVGVGATNATTNQQELMAGIVRDANAEVTNLLKPFGMSKESRIYKGLQEADAKNGTNTASQYQDDLIKKSIARRSQQNAAPAGGGSSASTSPAANPLVMDGFLFPDKKSLDAYKAKKAQG